MPFLDVVLSAAFMPCSFFVFAFRSQSSHRTSETNVIGSDVLGEVAALRWV